MFWLSEKNASKARLREAENARKNRAEIVKARSQGQVTRRELFKMGLFTAGGALALKNGLSPFAKSAYADNSAIPTGTPRSPFPKPGDKPFTMDMLRLHELTPQKLTAVAGANGETDLMWPPAPWMGEDGTVHPAEMIPTMRRSNHPDKRNINKPIQHTVNVRQDPRGVPAASMGPFGPVEGRAPGEAFAHQRWAELITPSPNHPLGPVGYVVSHGQIVTPGSVPGPFNAVGFNFSVTNKWETQLPNSIWTFGEGRFVPGGNSISTALRFPVMVQGRYGEPIVLRDYNNLPFELENTGGFGRQEPTTHNHNAHNAGESDGAGNAHFFPGEYYDYLWSTMLARHDFTLPQNSSALARLNAHARLDGKPGGFGLIPNDPRASTPVGPEDGFATGDIKLVPGDFREIQGTMWFHDHRIFFTSENVYKGYAALLEYFSGPDRGYERDDLTPAANKVNLRLPSGWRNKKRWGNRDFDIYFLVQDIAFTPDGQLFFDIFDTDGFLGDVIHVNYQWKPTLKVLPRKYRFRILSAGMSRWVKLAIADVEPGNGPDGLNPNSAKPVRVTQIANDGNLFPHFVRDLTELDQQSTAERFDIIVDFSPYKNQVNKKKLYLVNLLQHANGRKPDKGLTLGQALSGQSPDPAVGAIMQFEVVDSVRSVDNPNETNTIANACGLNDMSLDNDPGDDWQIPPVKPDRTRTIELVRGLNQDSGLPFDHPLGDEPWAVRVNGGAAHNEDMRRVSNLPSPGDVEHWTLKSGGGWGHPLHLHFEEAITLNRDGKTDPGSIHPTEFMKRKDVWHIGGVCCGFGSDPTIQAVFSEFGGPYVNHCHNTVHEDNAMLIRYDLIKGKGNSFPGIDDTHATIVPIPDPRAEGVTYVKPCWLKEGNPQGFTAGGELTAPDAPAGSGQCGDKALGTIDGTGLIGPTETQPPLNVVPLSGDPSTM